MFLVIKVFFKIIIIIIITIIVSIIIIIDTSCKCDKCSWKKEFSILWWSSVYAICNKILTQIVTISTLPQNMQCLVKAMQTNIVKYRALFFWYVGEIGEGNHKYTPCRIMLRCKIQETYFNLLQDVCTAAPCNNDAFYDNLCIITMVAALDK